MIVDFHTHILSPHIKSNRSSYAARDAGFALIYTNPKARIATAEELIDSMDRNGIDVSVIANYAWSTRELCTETNDYIINAVARYPKRLIGFGMVIPSDPQAAVTEVERCARGGLKGIGELRLDAIPPHPDATAALKSILEATREHHLVLLLHASEPVGHLYPGKGSATPDKLYSVITGFPDMNIVCAHWGGGLPFYTLMPEVKEAFKNVYFDTAASPFLYQPRIYNIASKLAGADKIIFGSDYPLMPQQRVIDEILSTELPQEAKEQILSGNARTLLGI
jgi:predicted TIM-barrel fold metal-dependent hydrolase